MLVALLLVVYIGAIGVAAAVLLVAIEAFEPNLGAQGSHHGCGRCSSVEPVARLRCLIVSLDPLGALSVPRASLVPNPHSNSLRVRLFGNTRV